MNIHPPSPSSPQIYTPSLSTQLCILFYFKSFMTTYFCTCGIPLEHGWVARSYTLRKRKELFLLEVTNAGGSMLSVSSSTPCWDFIRHGHAPVSSLLIRAHVYSCHVGFKTQFLCSHLLPQFLYSFSLFCNDPWTLGEHIVYMFLLGLFILQFLNLCASVNWNSTSLL